MERTTDRRRIEETIAQDGLTPRDIKILKNIPLAFKIADNYQQLTQFEPDQLKSEALVGLIKAVDGFNPELGEFQTYAGRSIATHVGRYVKKNISIIHIEQGGTELGIKINKYIESFSQEHFRPPFIEEISDALKVSGEDIAQVYNAQNPIEIDAHHDKNESLIGWLLYPMINKDKFRENPTEREALEQVIVKILVETIADTDKLTEDDKKILYWLYYEERTLKEIGSELGLTLQAVHARKKTIIEKLRRVLWHLAE